MNINKNLSHKFEKAGYLVVRSLFSKKEIPIFYYLKHDLEESIIGTDSLVNLYYFYLFEQIAENFRNYYSKPDIL